MIETPRGPVVESLLGRGFVVHSINPKQMDQFRHIRLAYRTSPQLGLLERFHQTLKTEEVYWCLYEGPGHARSYLAEFRERCKQVRPHWVLVPLQGGNPVTPAEVYAEGMIIRLPKWQTWVRAAWRKLMQMAEGEHFPLADEAVRPVA